MMGSEGHILETSDHSDLVRKEQKRGSKSREKFQCPPEEEGLSSIGP